MRILLVEDEEKVARFVTLGLRAEGLAIDHAKDGAEGLALAGVNPYDLLIVDLLLPRMSGTELIRRVRARDGDVPMITSPSHSPLPSCSCA